MKKYPYVIIRKRQRPPKQKNNLISDPKTYITKDTAFLKSHSFHLYKKTIVYKVKKTTKISSPNCLLFTNKKTMFVRLKKTIKV